MLTFGPPVVASVRRRHPEAFLDVHLAVDNPHEYVDALKAAGASQILFHPEAMTSGTNQASELVSMGGLGVKRVENATLWRAQAVQ